MSGGGGSSGGGTTVAKTEPPEYVQGDARLLLQRARDLSSNAYMPYGGQRIASLGPEFGQGLSMMSSQAAGNPITRANMGLTADTLSGRYLAPDSNPYLRSSVDAALGQAGSKINSMFSGNNFGSSAHSETLGRTLGQVATDAYRQNYDTERQNQLKTSVFAPQVSASGYQDAQALMDVASRDRAERQSGLDLNYQNFQEAQQWPYKQLQFYGSMIPASIGNASTTTQTTNAGGGSSAAGALGGAAAGAGLYSLMGAGPLAFSNPWALGAMAAGGLLGGMFK